MTLKGSSPAQFWFQLFLCYLSSISLCDCCFLWQSPKQEGKAPARLQGEVWALEQMDSDLDHSLG